MKEERLGELSEERFEATINAVLDEAFDQMPASEFFGTLRAMDEADTPERVVVKGHNFRVLKNGREEWICLPYKRLSD